MIRVSDRSEITQEMVLEFFHYNPSTGVLIRLKQYDSYGNICDVNEPVLSKNNRGYYWCGTFGKQCLAHRLIWLYMTGEHPTDEIDHINGIRTDNRWKNLRQVTAFENSRNQGVRKDCTSGVRGVTYVDRTNRRGNSYWQARISHKGVRYSLGHFKTKEEAVKARKQAEFDFGYHKNHGKRGSHQYG